jgi:CheY-like chemotaxis protein
MRTALDRVIDLLGNNRDYVLLALSVLVLVEGGIIVLWARKAILLKRSLDAAVADAEQHAAKAAKAVAAAAQTPQTYRVATAAREDAGDGVTVREGDRKTYTAAGRTTPLPSAPPPAPARAPQPAPAPAAEAPATDDSGAYTTPVAEQAASWVLPEVEAGRSAEPPAAPAPHVGLPPRPRPALSWSPEETAAATASSEPAPTTLGWSGTSVPIEPAPDFAVITDPDAIADLLLPQRPAATPSASGNGHANGSGNGHANGNGSGGLRDTVAWATPAPAPAQPAAAAPVWDMAMFDSNAETPTDDHPAGNDILLVEDDPTITRLYRVLLESRGYGVRVAADGLEGLDCANEKRPDLVLLDIMMPRMNGIAFLQALRSGEMRTVPVVVLSNFMEKQLVDDAMALGALEYMVKAQTRPEALAGALPHWLRGERAFSS